MVNTEPTHNMGVLYPDYNILNIVVNTELIFPSLWKFIHYNILNIVVNTEPAYRILWKHWHYNILNIVVNTERKIYK